MPAITTIELLSEAARYDGQVIAHCACGHSGPIDLQRAIDKAPSDYISRIGQWVRCRKCGADHPRLELALPDGQRREYRRG